jgi:hypothetical protein
MRFLPDPDPPAPQPGKEAPIWAIVLFASAVITGLATRWPWICVKFERLFGSHSGPPAWQSTVGFTCLCTSLMVAVMALAESGTPASRQAVRPGSLLLALLALATLVAAGFAGPGNVGNVSGAWTSWFYVACTSLPVLAFVCLRRWVVLHHRGE